MAGQAQSAEDLRRQLGAARAQARQAEQAVRAHTSPQPLPPLGVRRLRLLLDDLMTGYPPPRRWCGGRAGPWRLRGACQLSGACPLSGACWP